MLFNHDLPARALVVWALTGIVMLGVVAVSVGLLLAAIVMIGTDSELRLGNVRPGEARR